MSQTITSKDLDDTKNRIFFIMGTSRSGSTLLQSMLSSHSELIVPPETHFFHSYQHLRDEYNRTTEKSSFRDGLVDFWYDHKTRIRDLDLQKEDVLQLANNLNLTAPLDLFILQLTMYRIQRDKPILGEKTPRHMLHIPEILAAFPDAKIISLFRDPRAKAYSEIKTKFGSPSVFVSAKRWRKYVQVHQRFEKELSDEQYMMLRYTDLISDVEGVLQKICAFLGVSFQEQMLNYYNRDEKGFADGENSWKKQTLKPIQKNKNKEWKSALTDWQIVLIEKHTGKYLKYMNYQKWSEASFSFPKKMYWQAIDFSRSVLATLSGSRGEGYSDPNKFTLNRN
ncbi:MAG: sulfotransferase [Balneolaceae bacterium]|nr:sulfotransferase [Balneolaceae bacterium]